MSKKVERYSDIIDLPHHQSVRRPHMTNYNRAAQFAPFSALVGYEQMVEDAVDMLLLDRRMILSEDQESSLNEKINHLMLQLDTKPKVKVIYFDRIAKGVEGKYTSYLGILRRIEKQPARLIMMDHKEIYVCDVLDIDENV